MSLDEYDDNCIKIHQDLNKLMTLNVGGKEFICRQSTLLSCPHLTTSLKNFAESKQSSIFIDRDPDLFVFILRFLRNSQYDFTFVPKDILVNLPGEMQYFGMDVPDNLRIAIKKSKQDGKTLLLQQIISLLPNLRGPPGICECKRSTIKQKYVDKEKYLDED